MPIPSFSLRNKRLVLGVERNRFPTSDRLMKATGWLAGRARAFTRLQIDQVADPTDSSSRASVVEDEDEVWEAARPPRTTSINLSLMTGKLIISEACS